MTAPGNAGTWNPATAPFEWSHYSRSATARQEFSPHPRGAFLSQRSAHGILTISVCGEQNQEPIAAPDG